MASSDQQFSTRTSDGRFGRATNATSSFIGPARITYIQVEGVADSNIKLYDGTDNKDLINTKTTSKVGDFVVIASLNSTAHWTVVDAQGVFAKEA